MTRVKGCTCECTCGPAPAPDLDGEEWRAIPGLDGRYEVSNMGRVRSYVRRGPGMATNSVPKILTGTIDPDGYRIVGLGRKLFKVHRLVLEAFVGPSDLLTRHLNSIPDDNRLENLAWGTQLENMRDRVLAGRHNGNKKVGAVA